MELKIAIVHDWLATAGGAGGAEKTLEAVLEIFPRAHLYTTVPSAIVSFCLLIAVP